MDPTLAVLVASKLRQAVRYVQPGSGTLAAALAAVGDNTMLVLAPGTYTGAVTIPRTLSAITLVGAGGRGSVLVQAPSNGVALTNHGDDVTLLNVGLAGQGTGGGLLNDGDRFRADGCKFSGGADAVILAQGSNAQVTAGTHGHGADAHLTDCEIAQATNGVVLLYTNQAGILRPVLQRCRFHALTAAAIAERTGTSGAVTAAWFGLEVSDGVFQPLLNGTAPTKYLDLNDDNANTGIVARCSFPTAINGGLNLVSTKCLWIGNAHTGGIAAAQPS